jgi:hypothetical protein
LPKYDWEVPTKAELTDLLQENQTNSVTMKFSAELIESILGTIPGDKNLFTNFVSEKMGEFQGKPLKTMDELEEEIDSVPDIEKTATGFHQDVFGIFIYNYMILGNIKANIAALMSNGYGKVCNYKKTADLMVKVNPRKIRFYRGEEVIMRADGNLERPCRAQTAKGERIFLAKSEIIDPGARFKFEVTLFRNDKGLTPEFLVEALKFSKHYGLGQWRGSGGYGKYKLISVKY